jgi:predicted nucleotide-binding protein
MALHAQVRGSSGAAYLFNVDEKELQALIVRPWLEGRALVLEGRQFTQLASVQIRVIDGPPVPRRDTRSQKWSAASGRGTDVTNLYIRDPAGSQAVPVPPEAGGGPAGDPRKVMVIYGRDDAVTSSMFNILRALGLEPLEWSKLVALTGVGTPYIGQVLDAAFSKARVAVVVLTPDEEVRLRKGLRDAEEPTAFALQPRPNVFFEAGLALGRFPDHTVIVEVGRTRGASDLGGRHTIRVDQEGVWRNELAQRLETAGCEVDRAGTEWLRVGAFESALTARPADQPHPATQHPTSEDQDVLNGVFRMLPRRAIREIRSYDFGAS